MRRLVFVLLCCIPLATALPLSARPARAFTWSFSNPNSITIPNQGAASPYPSSISVSTSAGEKVSRVTVTLRNISHDSPDDIDVLLVGPGGQAVVLLARAGGYDPGNYATLTFDQLAPANVADEGGLVTGTYQPSNYGSPSFPAPAPPGPYASGLGVFKGTDPSGTWSLYVYDSTLLDDGLIGGWDLKIVTDSFRRSSTNLIRTTSTPSRGVPYPSTVSVAGLTGTVKKVAARLNSLSHTNPADIDVLLVGPSGENVILMSDAGGSADVTDATLQFSDGFGPLPGASTIVSGTYRPTNYAGGDVFASPAPAGPYGSALSVFNGTNPDGDWKLFIQDHSSASGGSGAIGGGWTLSVTTTTTGQTLFSNSGQIRIGDDITADSYPANISVNDLTGTISKVTVTLRGLSHTNPGDLDVLLVGPQGQKVLLMSDAGGSSDVSKVTLTFDQSATSSLPSATALTTGSYKPTNFGTSSDLFPSPAPEPSYGSSLNSFNGTNPNGAWSLYVIDDRPALDSGSLTGGWSLAITTNTAPVVPAVADITLNEGTSVQRKIVVNDPDNEAVTFNITPTLSFVNLLSTNDGRATLFVAPGGSDAGEYDVTVTASAGGQSDDEAIHITVLDDSTPPETTFSVYPQPVNGWIRGTSATVTIYAADSQSFIYELHYSATGAGAFAEQVFEPPFGYARAVAKPEVTAEGVTTISAFAIDTAGNQEDPAVTQVVRLDQTGPVTRAPAATLVAPFTTGTDSALVNIAWSASDALSGIDHYELEEGPGDGSFVPVTLSSPTQTRIRLNLAPNATYQFRVRAIDVAGNVSEATGEAFFVEADQEDSPAIGYVGSWTTQVLSSSFGGSVCFANEADARATLTFTGKSVAWVTTLAANRGIAEVRLDGALVATVDLFSATTQKRRIVFARNKLASGTHTLEVRVTGTKNESSTATRVDIDGFIVLR